MGGKIDGYFDCSESKPQLPLQQHAHTPQTMSLVCDLAIARHVMEHQSPSPQTTDHFLSIAL